MELRIFEHRPSVSADPGSARPEAHLAGFWKGGNVKIFGHNGLSHPCTLVEDSFLMPGFRRCAHAAAAVQGKQLTYQIGSEERATVEPMRYYTVVKPPPRQ